MDFREGTVTGPTRDEIFDKCRLHSELIDPKVRFWVSLPGEGIINDLLLTVYIWGIAWDIHTGRLNILASDGTKEFEISYDTKTKKGTIRVREAKS